MESQPNSVDIYGSNCKVENIIIKITTYLLNILKLIFLNSDGFNSPQPPKQAFGAAPPFHNLMLIESPCRGQCPSCQNTIVTTTQPKIGMANYAVAAALCVFGYA